MTIDKATVEEDWPRLKERLIDEWGAFIRLYSFLFCRFACIFEAGGLSFEYYVQELRTPSPFLMMTSEIVLSCACLLAAERKTRALM